MMGVKGVLFQWFVKCLIKNLLVVVVVLKMGIFQTELVEELLGLIIRKFEKKKVHSPFIDNIWGDLANTQFISKFNKEIHFLLYAVLIFSVNVHGLFFWKIKKV